MLATSLMRLPHARGGVSLPLSEIAPTRVSSPRPWGCFFFHISSPFEGFVFPTPVGVFLGVRLVPGAWQGLPHARGGVSAFTIAWQMPIASSPRPWGCFLSFAGAPCRVCVFPTPVGVFLKATAAECVQIGLPHARGGVSYVDAEDLTLASSSPRPWGCFSIRLQPPPHGSVFPTPVGVFLRQTRTRFHGACLPHARGGVSAAK